MPRQSYCRSRMTLIVLVRYICSGSCQLCRFNSCPGIIATMPASFDCTYFDQFTLALKDATSSQCEEDMKASFCSWLGTVALESQQTQCSSAASMQKLCLEDCSIVQKCTTSASWDCSNTFYAGTAGQCIGNQTDAGSGASTDGTGSEIPGASAGESGSYNDFSSTGTNSINDGLGAAGESVEGSKPEGNFLQSPKGIAVLVVSIVVFLGLLLFAATLLYRAYQRRVHSLDAQGGLSAMQAGSTSPPPVEFTVTAYPTFAESHAAGMEPVEENDERLTEGGGDYLSSSANGTPEQSRPGSPKKHLASLQQPFVASSSVTTKHSQHLRGVSRASMENICVDFVPIHLQDVNVLASPTGLREEAAALGEGDVGVTIVSPTGAAGVQPNATGVMRSPTVHSRYNPDDESSPLASTYDDNAFSPSPSPMPVAYGATGDPSSPEVDRHGTIASPSGWYGGSSPSPLPLSGASIAMSGFGGQVSPSSLPSPNAEASQQHQQSAQYPSYGSSPSPSASPSPPPPPIPVRRPNYHLPHQQQRH